MDVRSDSAVPNFIQRTNTPITAPDDIEDDDILLLLFEIGGNPAPPTPTPPSGFVSLALFPGFRVDSNGFRVDTHAWLKVASGEAGDYTITHANAPSQAYMLAAPGADIVAPISPAPTRQTGLGTVATALGLTTTIDQSLIVYWCGKWNWPGITPPGGTTPTLTERESGDSGPLYVATGVLSPPGATGDKVATDLPQASNEPWASGLIAIKAAAATLPQPSTYRKRRRMLLDATPIKVLEDVAADETTSEPFGLTDDIIITVDFKTGVTAGVVTFESAPGADYEGTWKEEATITFAGAAPLVLSDRITPENAVGRLRVSTAIADGVIDVYIQRSLAGR